ncbi:hypothetical protein V5O48_018838, partial [Marasmius crinis-equi]
LIRSGPRNGSRGPQERRHTCSPSPVGADGRAATPTPLPERSPSPLDTPSPSEASRGPSAKRKTPHSQPEHERHPKRQQGSSSKATVPVSSKKRKADATEATESKKRRTENASSNDTTHLDQRQDYPELPDGVGGGDPRFYAAQALIMFKRTEIKELRGWIPLVWKWFELEQRGGFDGKQSQAKLWTRKRPKWVGEWIQRARNPEYLPQEGQEQPSKVLEDWWAWWEVLQPKWRAFDKARPRAASEYDEGSWDSICAIGPNGLTSVACTPVYVAKLLTTVPSGGTGRDKKTHDDTRAGLQRAVDDVGYVLQRVLSTADA